MSDLADGIKRAIEKSSLGYRKVAELLAGQGIATTKDTVSLWANGRQRPWPEEVFAIERVLGLKPGSLSRLDGYLPVGARSIRSVREAIDFDVRLSAEAKAILISAFDHAVQSD